MKFGKKTIAILVALLVIVMSVGIFAACGGEEPPGPGGSGTALTYTGGSLPDATVGTAYVGTVATATGADTVTYALKDGSSLPGGMTLSRTGRLGGTPTAVAEGHKFTVVASAEGFTDAEAEFTISVVRPSLTYRGTTLADATVGEEYSYSVATASGAENITYALAEDAELPAGLTLSENGTISGTPETAVDNATFGIVASADGMDPVTAEFTITVYWPNVTFEAEWAFDGGTDGCVYTSSDSSSGRGYVDFRADKHENSSISLTFNSSAVGSVRLSLGIGLRSDLAQSLSGVYNITLNGEPLDTETELSKGGGWTDWHSVRYCDTEVVSGPNTLVISADGDNALCLDYVRFEVMEEQTLLYGDCTKEYGGTEAFKLLNTDADSLSEAFGEGYTLESVYNMDEFLGADLGNERKDIKSTFGDLAYGSYDLLVSASKDGKTEKMIIPAEVVRSMNMFVFEAEGSNATIASGEDRDGQTVTPQKDYDSSADGGGCVDFHGGGSVTFEFTSNKAAAAELILGVGLNGEMKALSDVYDIKINGISLEGLSEIQTPANRPGTTPWRDWYDLTIGMIQLNEGTNTIEVVGTDSPLILDNITLAFDDADVTLD